jgi:hypothetical protein
MHLKQVKAMDQVWGTVINHIHLLRGFLYLV